jgi:uncharacterized protein YecE (DUF72 family)
VTYQIGKKSRPSRGELQESLFPEEKIERQSREPGLLRLGTSSFTASGWERSFYPRGLQSRDYLSYYATQFDTLEVDSTYYGIPAVKTVQNWYAKTPKHFLFALKAPQEITHERVLVDAQAAFSEFMRATEPLGEKLGIILLQFPHFSTKVFSDGSEFLARLTPFLEKLPGQSRFALEIRNKSWLGPGLYDLLRKHKVALAFVDHPWMLRPDEWLICGDALTADFAYIRWLGDRKEIEEQTKIWDKTIVDRTGDLEQWVKACRNFMQKKIRVFAFANNHYAGHAPGTLRLFEKLMNKE